MGRRNLENVTNGDGAVLAGASHENSFDNEKTRRHVPGNYESSKFESLRPLYEEYIDALPSLPYDSSDYLKYFPLFVGHLTLARFLSIHERYKETLGLAGHIADVGVFKGSSLFFFAKLCKIYESMSITQVHGFEWFKGNLPSGRDGDNLVAGGGAGSREVLETMVALQNLTDVVRVHDLDLTRDLKNFGDENPHLMFRLVFMDCGLYKVVSEALPFFWDRLVPGGLILFDQYNFDVAPGETLAVNEFFASKGQRIRADPHGWMPTAFVEKGGN